MAYNGRRLTKIRKEKSIYVNEYEKETRHRRGGGLRRHRRRDGRGSAERVLSHYRQGTEAGRLLRRTRYGQLEGGRIHHPRRGQRPRGSGQRTGQHP